MNNNQTLEMQILAKSEDAIKSLDKLISMLTGVEKAVGNVDKTINNGTVKTFVTNIDQLKSSSDKATKSAKKLGKALTLTGAYFGVKRLTQQFLQWMDLAVDRTEQMNLFNVVFKNISKNGVRTFSELGKEATRFQNRLNEAFGTNMTETFKFQGLFQSMGENVGIPDLYSAIMSETMTKLTYDLASLYNKSESTTGEALRAGVYAGQTKPLRSFGIDVTQTSMQPILEELGINDRTIKQMSQAEKEILRYLATLKQAKIAMGDFANTIESPSNQLKIFRQQLIEAKIAITSLFMGTFAQILPYANAFLMVIREIAETIADIFGIELTDYNSGIASSEDAYKTLEDSIDGATDSIKELKRQTLGFDQINNINEKNNSNGDGNLVGGIDQRLLDAIKGYDNGMDRVRMKATEIRDRIMEWLGFTKQTNDETNETYFTYDGIEKTISSLTNWWKELNIQGKIWTTLGIGLGFINLYKIITKLASFMGITTLFNNIAKTIKKISSSSALLKGSISKIASIFTKLGSSLGMTTGALGVVVGLVLAIGGAFIYAYTKNDEFKNKVHETISSISNIFLDLFNIVSTVAKEIFGVLEPVWEIIKVIAVPIIQYLYESVVLSFSLILDVISGTCKIISDLIHGDFDKAFDDAGKMVENLFGDWNTWLEKIKKIFSGFSQNIIDTVIDLVPKTINKLSEILTWIKELPNKFFYYAGLAVGTLIKKITETDWLALGKKVLEGIVTGIKDMKNSLVSFGSDLWNKIWESIRNINWYSIGQNILDGITNGLMNFGAKLNNWGTSFVNGLKDALGIHSPARLVIDAKIGDYTTDGIIVGMKNEIPKLKSTAYLMVDEVQKTFAKGNYDLEFGSIKMNSESSMSHPNLNQTSIQQVIIDSVGQAISRYGGQVNQIDVYVHTDEGTVVDRINQKTKQTGVCPINIPAY